MVGPKVLSAKAQKLLLWHSSALFAVQHPSSFMLLLSPLSPRFSQISWLTLSHPAHRSFSRPCWLALAWLWPNATPKRRSQAYWL